MFGPGKGMELYTKGEKEKTLPTVGVLKQANEIPVSSTEYHMVNRKHHHIQIYILRFCDLPINSEYSCFLICGFLRQLG